MPNDKKERLPGINGRYEFTKRFLRRTLHKVEAVKAKLGLLELIAIDLTKLAGELEKKACARDLPDPSEAVREFMDLSDWIDAYCLELGDLVGGPPVRVLSVKAPVEMRVDPSVNYCIAAN